LPERDPGAPVDLDHSRRLDRPGGIRAPAGDDVGTATNARRGDADSRRDDDDEPVGKELEMDAVSGPRATSATKPVDRVRARRRVILGPAADGTHVRVVEGRRRRRRWGRARFAGTAARDQDGRRGQRHCDSGTILTVHRLPAFAAALGGVALASPSAALAHGRTVAPAHLGSAWEASPLVFVSAAIAL